MGAVHAAPPPSVYPFVFDVLRPISIQFVHLIAPTPECRVVILQLVGLVGLDACGVHIHRLTYLVCDVQSRYRTSLLLQTITD